MNHPYVYSMSGRRPATLFALFAAMGFVTFGWTFGAPWFALAPALIVMPLVLYTIIANPTYGMRLDRQALEIDRNGNHRRFLLSSIDHVRMTEWNDGASVTIHFKDGTRELLPHMVLPSKSKLHEVLSAFGVSIKED